MPKKAWKPAPGKKQKVGEILYHLTNNKLNTDSYIIFDNLSSDLKIDEMGLNSYKYSSSQGMQKWFSGFSKL